jgi:glycosyltransferase involved in cell wall biosynthesis
MRILMASDLYYPFLLGGGETRMYETARRLVEKHEIHVLTRRFKGLPSYEVHEGVHIHRVFVPSAGIKLESPSDGSAFMAGALLKGLNLGDFDLYAPQQFFPIFPLWLIAKAKRKPLVATIHDVYRETWLQKYGFKGCLMAAFEKVTLKFPYARIITVSSSSKKKLIESGVSGHRIEIIPNGVDVGKYDEVKVEKSDRPRVIYVGRLIGYKHVDDLLVAFSRLDLDAELYIVGEGPERKKLEDLAEKLKVNHNVTFTGFVDERKKIELLKSSHVLVLPSSTEGFGIAVIEAMAARTSVLATDIPALRELVEDGENGLLFKPRDINELKTKLELLLKDKGLQDKFSRGGYDLVGREFTWDRVAERVEEVHNDLINRT